MSEMKITGTEAMLTIADMKDLLRKGESLEYKGWVMTAEKKFKNSNDNRIWITAVKRDMKDEDDTLSYLFARIDEMEAK